jgi:hypothetical protein
VLSLKEAKHAETGFKRNAMKSAWMLEFARISTRLLVGMEEEKRVQFVSPSCGLISDRLTRVVSSYPQS